MCRKRSLDQERLGEQKYRQLRMHLTGALRLLGELAAEPNTAAANQTSATDLKGRTVTAMAALTERLRALPRKQGALPVRELSLTPKRKTKGKRS